LLTGKRRHGNIEYLPLAKQALDIINARERKADTKPIFDLQDNSEVNKKLKSIVAAVGIEGKKVTFHTARHTTAMLLLGLGVPIGVISDILGHSDISITQIYTKALVEQQEAAIHKLENFLDNQ
jgi:integrase